MMPFNDIKTSWQYVMDRAMPDYIKNGDMRLDPYFYNWDGLFSHIENLVWMDIRGIGVPLYPQYPACGYFIDFANPFLKIGVECDGKAFHNKEKDDLRDKKLGLDGWTIYRLTGTECMRNYHFEFYVDGEEFDDNKFERWLFETSEGFIYALKNIVFAKDKSEFVLENYDLLLRAVMLRESQSAMLARAS